MFDMVQMFGGVTLTRGFCKGTREQKPCLKQGHGASIPRLDPFLPRGPVRIIMIQIVGQMASAPSLAPGSRSSW